jgi:hypothetical protein
VYGFALSALRYSPTTSLAERHPQTCHTGGKPDTHEGDRQTSGRRKLAWYVAGRARTGWACSLTTTWEAQAPFFGAGLNRPMSHKRKDEK